MTLEETKEKLIEGQLTSFKEFIDLSCKEIAMCCRASAEMLKDRLDVRAYIAESAEKWFSLIDGMTDAEFEFMVHKDLIKRFVEEMEDDDDDAE